MMKFEEVYRLKQASDYLLNKKTNDCTLAKSMKR